MAEKSKILIIGGTGYIGKYIVEASAKAGHPTFALVRESTASDLVKGKLIESFKSCGVIVLYGDLYDHESLVKAIKQVDVVISTVGSFQIPDQVKIIAAIREAGNIKRFFASEFGVEVDLDHVLEPAKSIFEANLQIRRAIEAEEIPYTCVSCKLFAGYYVSTLVQIGATAPPRDEVTILGDGNTKAIFNEEHDIATYTIKAIGRTLEKIYVPVEQILKRIQEASFPVDLELAINHSLFVKGEPSNCEGVEASELYPDVEYISVEEYLEQFV
ncbi:hypothetical protein F0562_013531 [Nyssa sinensis]|uniref:NmrA-like domain-containing protein n=1 Tax=Nyssa sinensis TaxID=561372 RepID=A0A5J4ZL23_9ASTE|nr:hypothetical protein F0562_013531 [Nyssa sinensis]